MTRAWSSRKRLWSALVWETRLTCPMVTTLHSTSENLMSLGALSLSAVWRAFAELLCQLAALQQLPPEITMKKAREEAEMVLFESVSKTLKRAGIRPNQVHFRHSQQCMKQAEKQGTSAAIQSQCVKWPPRHTGARWSLWHCRWTS